MTLVQPQNLTMGDLVQAALRRCGWTGQGQTPNAEDLQEGWFYLQNLLAQWQRKRWMVYALQDLSIVSTGAISYTVGPGGQIATSATSQRPTRLERAYLRQLNAVGSSPVDYKMTILQSREDYSDIRLKNLTSFAQYAFLDTLFPLSSLYFWPIPQANVYELHIVVRVQLPTSFATQADKFSTLLVPPEYYPAMLFKLALALRGRYGITPPNGDTLTADAKDAMETIRGTNIQVAALKVPPELNKNGGYNIYSDQDY